MCTDFHAFTTKCQVASLIWVGHIGFGGHLENFTFFATPPTLILISISRRICVPIFMLLLKSARFGLFVSPIRRTNKSVCVCVCVCVYIQSVLMCAPAAEGVDHKR